MKVLLDTNIVLDVLLDRKPFSRAAARIFALTEQSLLKSYICATTVTTVDYLLLQALEKPQARSALKRLLGLFEIAPVNRPVIEQALGSKVQDFEDAVLEQSAHLVGAQAIISRNTKDFKQSIVKTLEPVEFLESFNA